MDAIPKNWGYPGPKSTHIQHIKYSNHMRTLTPEEQQSIDLILIDGRFRVACCLKCFDIISPDCLIVFDDFLDRPQYHVVLDYYDVVEKTTDNRMVILRKKKHKNSVLNELISKYELIPN
jgi:predicted O-methyltransferase YrrM